MNNIKSIFIIFNARKTVEKVSFGLVVYEESGADSRSVDDSGSKVALEANRLQTETNLVKEPKSSDWRNLGVARHIST